jgi:uncharacterized membrane protein
LKSWSFDILRQSGFDLWTVVCIAACVVLLGYAVAAGAWKWRMAMIVTLAIALTGTSLVAILPQLHQPLVGLLWTLVLMILVSAIFYWQLRSQLQPRHLWILLCLRIAAVVLLVLMLFEPVLRFITKPSADRPLIFLIDTSASMSFPDVQNGPTRLQSVWNALSPQLPRVKERFSTQFFAFAGDFRELNNPDDIAKAQATGQSTDIAGAVGKAMDRTTRDDGAVILISDGIDNASADVVDAIRASHLPVHTISVGSDQAEPATIANVAVDEIDPPDDFVVRHETKIKATIRSTALANRVVDVKLSELTADGKPTGETSSQSLVLQPLPSGQSVELSYKPPTTGIHRLAVWIDPIAGERSVVDNRQEFQILALDPRIKVLYVEGRARPESQQLSRALARDSNIELATLIRLQQDRFSAMGTADGEPVKSLPNSLDQWKKFDVILIGDLDSSFLTPLQQNQIEQAISSGTGLLMIGGQSTFGPGGYKGTPIEKVLPVQAGEKNAPQEASPFVPRLTADGAAHPAMEGLSEWFGVETDKPTRELPPLRGNVVVPGAKTGAQILLIHQDRPGTDGSPQIALAVQRYGEGRSAAFTCDTTYLWYLPLRGMGQESPYNRFWGQLIRWLANEDVRNRQRGAGLDVLINKTVYELGQTVRIRALVRDEKGDATRYAQVNLTLTSADGKTKKQFPLAPSDARTGMYDVSIPGLGKGEWSAEVLATKDGKQIGKHSLKFSIIPPADEMLKIAANPRLMSQIASATRGYHYSLPELPSLIDGLIRAQETDQPPTQQSVPLASFLRMSLAAIGKNPTWNHKYDLPMQASLVFIALCFEWALRRRWQLP